MKRASPTSTGQDLDATTPVRALGTWFGQPALSARLMIVSDSLGTK
jgi:hypothetical protein